MIVNKLKKITVACFMVFFSILAFAETNKYYTEAQKYKMVNASLAKAASITDISSAELEVLIHEKSFVKLEELLRDIENKYKKDPAAYEGNLLRSFESFTRIENKFGTTLVNFNQWVELRQSYVAYAARGYFIAGEAARYRGTRYISQTPKANLFKAKELWKLALDDFKLSLKLNPEFVPSYDQILKISRSSGDSELAANTLAKVLKIVPQTYYVRANYVEFLQPKWGGAFEEANKFIGEAQIYGTKNPQIWRLRGFVASEQAYQYLLDENYVEAINKYTEALKYGDRLYWLANQGYAFYRLGNIDAAIENVAKVEKYLANDKKPIALQLVETMKAELEGIKRQSFGASKNPSQHQQQFVQSLSWDDFSKLW